MFKVCMHEYSRTPCRYENCISESGNYLFFSTQFFSFAGYDGPSVEAQFHGKLNMDYLAETINL